MRYAAIGGLAWIIEFKTHYNPSLSHGSFQNPPLSSLFHAAVPARDANAILETQQQQLLSFDFLLLFMAIARRTAVSIFRFSSLVLAGRLLSKMHVRRAKH